MTQDLKKYKLQLYSVDSNGMQNNYLPIHIKLTTRKE